MDLFRFQQVLSSAFHVVFLPSWKPRCDIWLIFFVPWPQQNLSFWFDTDKICTEPGIN